MTSDLPAGRPLDSDDVLSRDAPLAAKEPIPNTRLCDPDLVGEGLLPADKINGALQSGRSHTDTLPSFWYFATKKSVASDEPNSW
jgi:hypothetical protein